MRRLAEVRQHLKHVADRPITPQYCATLKGHLLAEFVFDRILYKIVSASEGHGAGEVVVIPKLTKPLRTFYLSPPAARIDITNWMMSAG